MALLFMDSFDHYATGDLLEKWTSQVIGTGGSIAITAGAGRRASASLRIAAGAFQTCHVILSPAGVSGATCVVGLAVKPSGLQTGGNVSLIAVREGGNPQVTFALAPDGTIRVTRGGQGGTLLGTTSAPLSVGIFNYLELKVLIHATAGTVDVRLNGQSVLALTGINTLGTSTAIWNSFAIGNAESSAQTLPAVDFDDLYVLDGTGAAPWNALLGDCRVDVRLPTGAGAEAQWTPSTGANWSCVDEIPPNDDTDYTAATAAPLTDTFVVQDAPVPGAVIFGVQHNINAKKMDAGTCAIGAVVRQGGVDYPSAGQGLTTAYAFTRVVQATNPATGAQWLEADFNLAEFGYKRTA